MLYTNKERKRLETKEDVSDLENQIRDLTVNYDGVSKQARTLSGEAKKETWHRSGQSKSNSASYNS